MIDLRIIEVRDIIPILQVELVHGLSPKTYRARGLDFRYVQDVWINDVKSPSVFIEDDRTLYAQVPDAVVSQGLLSIQAVSSRLTNTQGSRIDFALGDATGTISGIDRLVQTFVKLLLQTPGTDAFARSLGGGVLKAAGKLLGKRGASSLVSDVQMGVDRVRRQLIAIQANDPYLVDTEKLLYARLLEARYSPNELSLNTRIDLANQALRSTVVSLEV